MNCPYACISQLLPQMFLLLNGARVGAIHESPMDISCFFVILLNAITRIVLLNMKLYHLDERAFLQKTIYRDDICAIPASLLCHFDVRRNPKALTFYPCILLSSRYLLALIQPFHNKPSLAEVLALPAYPKRLEFRNSKMY